MDVDGKDWRKIKDRFCVTNWLLTWISLPTVLGNHDYRGDAEAQFSPFLR
ncbi:hypothetical protein Goari_007763 [Gossypium aridum]|nr:hypothetical protein [Gossypium aridum]